MSRGLIIIQSPTQIRPFSRAPCFSLINSSSFSLIPLKNHQPKICKRIAIHAKNGKDGFNGGGGGGGDEDVKKDGGLGFNLKWRNLLDPDPDNLYAVALSGLLAWASVQVLGQLVFISLAILVAALKYSFIAALLIFILITLL